jgi:hypothetical protein
MIDRRTFLTRLAGVAVVGAGAGPVWAQLPFLQTGGTPITVYKSKSCGCCANWVDYLRGAGFSPTVFDQEDMDSIKDSLGVPSELRSCHTAVLDRYLIEGHVPVADMRRLVAGRSKLQGLAVPGMPQGTPGMAAEGAPIQGFEVIGFSAQGSRSTFARY